MTEAKSTRGGRRPGAGRIADAVPKRYVQVRMTEAEHEIVRANGGSKFMRELLVPVASIVSFMAARHTSPRAALASFDAVCAEHFPDAPDWVIRSARRTIEARFYQC